MDANVNIIAWGAFVAVLIALIVLFIVIRRSRLKQTSTPWRVIVILVFCAVAGLGSYTLLSSRPHGLIGGDVPVVVAFPSTGFVPTTRAFVEFAKRLYATPMDGLMTSALLVLIGFMVSKIIRPDKRQIEKDLEEARIITQRFLEDLQAEKARLAEAKAKDDAMLASIGDGVIMVDPAGNITLMNQSAQDMLGWASGAVAGKLLFDILPIEDEKGDRMLEKARPMAIALAGGVLVTEAAPRVYYYIRKDQTKFPADVTVAPVMLEGKIIGAIEVFRDITKEQEIDKAKTEFISIASHQLRTPVSGLNWLTEALRFTSENLNPKQKKYVDDLSMLSKRLIELVEDLLNISRIQLKTPLMTEKAHIEIVGFIEAFMKEIEPYANLKKHTVVFHAEVSGPFTIEMNKKSLYNVLQNLVSNAIEYSPEHTVATINLEKIDDFMKVSISNKGPVIPKEEQPHLFGRFYRGESAKKMKTDGTGLGLYIIKTIIEAAGGTVGFASEEGIDTTFWFRIPLSHTS